MDERMVKLEALIKDDAKVIEIFGGTPEEALKKLADNGIVLTQAEFDQIMAGMHSKEDDGTLTEEELSEVAGGGKTYDFFYKVGQAVDKTLYRIFGHK